MKHMLAALLPILATGLAYASPMRGSARLLATNTVLAEYIDTVHRTCSNHPSGCPATCDHASALARFLVIENKAYSRHGDKADEKAEPRSMLIVEAFRSVPGQNDAAIQRAISQLKGGDQVILTVQHYTVHDRGVDYPSHPVTQLTKVSIQSEDDEQPDAPKKDDSAAEDETPAEDDSAAEDETPAGDDSAAEDETPAGDDSAAEDDAADVDISPTEDDADDE